MSPRNKNNSISMRTVLNSGHADYVLERWLKSKLGSLNTRGYVAFEGFTHKNKLFIRLI